MQYITSIKIDKFGFSVKWHRLTLYISCIGNCLGRFGYVLDLSRLHSGPQLVQLFVDAKGQLQMMRNDAGLLVVVGSITSQLQNLGRQKFQHGSQVDRSAAGHRLGILSFAQQTPEYSAGRNCLQLTSRPAGCWSGRAIPTGTSRRSSWMWIFKYIRFY